MGETERCIDEEIPFEIPENWVWCRLGAVSTYAHTKRKVNAQQADSSLWGLDLEDIEKGGRILEFKSVGERKATGDKTYFSKGDILYSKLRPYLLKILVAPKDGVCTPEIVPFSMFGSICADYIVAYLKSPYVDNLINSITYGVKMPRVGTDTAKLEQKVAALTEECEITATLIRKCVEENAHVSVDPRLYAQKYESLAARYTKAKEQLDAASDEIAQRTLRKDRIERFLVTLESSPQLITEFDEYLWMAVIDRVTVYSKDHFRFLFKSGTEVDWFAEHK